MNTAKFMLFLQNNEININEKKSPKKYRPTLLIVLNDKISKFIGTRVMQVQRRKNEEKIIPQKYFFIKNKITHSRR